MSDDDLSDTDFKEESESPEPQDGDSIPACRLPLGLDSKYCPFWSTGDAFREFYQNWSVLKRFSVIFVTTHRYESM